MRFRVTFAAAVCGLACCLFALTIGCGKPAEKKAAKADKKTKAEAATPAEDAKTATEKSADGSKEPIGTTEEVVSKPADAPAATASKRVLLGSPDLTAGIPGEGDLTVEQIKAWFDKPETLEKLEIDLPLGLNAGIQQAEAVLEANPMSRGMIELGRQLYFDKRLSSDGTISCASCHDPEQGFAAHTQFGVGVRGQTGGRNSPVSYNRIFSGPQFWDGRAGSLEEQAVGPIANPIEMANTHEQAVATVKGIEGYRMEFDKLFGGSDGANVNIDNIGKAIATFERAIVSGPSPFDYNEQLRAYASADLDELKEDPELLALYEKTKAAAAEHPMSESALRGREIFFTDKGSCTACHVGANLTDELHHNLGVGMDVEKPDLGRHDVTKDEKDKGSYKTPTIRNVALSAPYMHDGSHKTLEEVVAWYDKGGHPNPTLDPKIKKLNLTDQEKTDLVEFMKACTGDFPKIETGRLPK
ncbi:MAG TPA: cytochrome c peroxidase [Pirellulales bacterium]|jgi:cytochrome c peroxidase